MSRKHKRRDAIAVIRKAREALKTAQFGLSDLRGADPNRKTSGIQNVVVFGRAVTHILQTLRSIDSTFFETWYAPYVAEMNADPLMKWCKDLRNEILKEGLPDATSSSHHISYLGPQDFGRMMQNPPPNARAFFMLDPLGRCGWEVAMPDGSTENYYVQLPADIQSRLESKAYFPAPPTSHLGEALSDTSIDALFTAYLAYLAHLVADAEKTFDHL